MNSGNGLSRQGKGKKGRTASLSLKQPTLVAFFPCSYSFSGLFYIDLRDFLDSIFDGRSMTSQEENLCSNPGDTVESHVPGVSNQANKEEKDDVLNYSDSVSSFPTLFRIKTSYFQNSSISSESNCNRIPLKRSSSSNSSCELKNLPKFIASAPEGTVVVPTRTPTSPCGEFSAPKFPKSGLQLSRPNSPSNAGRPIVPRSRIANIRRESDCSLESEVAHERFIKTAVQVSTGFEDFCLVNISFNLKILTEFFRTTKLKTENAQNP